MIVCSGRILSLFDQSFLASGIMNIMMISFLCKDGIRALRLGCSNNSQRLLDERIGLVFGLKLFKNSEDVPQNKSV